MKIKGTPYEVNKAVNQFCSDEMNKGVTFVKCDISTPRNYEFHKKFFKFCEMVAEMQNLEIDGVRQIITVKSGYHDSIMVNSDYVYYYPKSISFANMSQDEFDKFYEKAVNSAFMIWTFTDEQYKQLQSF